MSHACSGQHSNRAPCLLLNHASQFCLPYLTLILAQRLMMQLWELQLSGQQQGYWQVRATNALTLCAPVMPSFSFTAQCYPAWCQCQCRHITSLLAF